jgi:hypothetical protein
MWRLIRLAQFGVLLWLCAGCGLGSSAASGSGRADSNTSIQITGAIGGVHPGDSRTTVDHKLGSGTTISTKHHHQPVGGDYTLTTVAYPGSQLVITYAGSADRRARVALISTTSSRYRTPDGLGVGSSLAKARREHGIRCSPQPGYYACQGGLGYEKPVTSFTVKNGRVVRVFVAAVAD